MLARVRVSCKKRTEAKHDLDYGFQVAEAPSINQHEWQHRLTIENPLLWTTTPNSPAGGRVSFKTSKLRLQTNDDAKLGLPLKLIRRFLFLRETEKETSPVQQKPPVIANPHNERTIAESKLQGPCLYISTMNRPKPLSTTSPFAFKPMGVTSTVITKNVTDGDDKNDYQPSLPRVDSAGNTDTCTATNLIGSSKTDSKPGNILLHAGNIRSLVFDTNNVSYDIPPDENASPSSVAGNKRKSVAGEIPVFEVKKLHAFRKDQMPVYWDITNLKPTRVTRHLRCLLLAVESRPAFDQIRPQYYQLRDHFVYSFGFLQIHSTAPQYQVKLQALYKLVFDELHRLLALADEFEESDEDDSDGDESEVDDEKESEPLDTCKRPRLG